MKEKSMPRAQVWRMVVGFEGRYLVSNYGEVLTLRGTPRLLKSALNQQGYPTVSLGRLNTRTLHSLVAEAFIGPCPKGQEVRHKNGVRAFPFLWNLEYGTRRQNMQDAMRHGRVPKGIYHSNYKHGKYSKYAPSQPI